MAPKELPEHAFEEFGKQAADSKPLGRARWPWSSNGKYGRAWASGRNPELDALILEATGGVDPGGYRQDRPIYAINRLPHNPYIILVQAGFLAVAALASFAWFQDMPFVGVPMGLLFVAFSIRAFYLGFRQIRPWRVARGVAQDYIASHGGEMPPELRIWS